MSSTKRSVLITGCSDGGMGSELAIAFHKAGLKVYATTRNVSKMEKLKGLGIETLALDVQSEASIAECVKQIPSLDILVNNAGQSAPIPVSDMSIADAKALFDVNVWAPVAVIQGFLPLLLKSKSALIVNHTSVMSVVPMPFQSVYGSSKAALASITESLRLELQPFGIQVVDLKTAAVRTNIVANTKARDISLPKDSIYQPAREAVERTLKGDSFDNQGITAEQWARETCRDLLKKNPPVALWKGEQATLGRLAAVLPYGMFDGMLKKMSGLDVLERELKK